MTRGRALFERCPNVACIDGPALMAPDDLRKRLAALNRGRLANRARPAPAAPEPAPQPRPPETKPLDRGGTPVEAISPSLRERAGAAISLSDVAPGEIVQNERGQFLRIVRAIEDLIKDCQEVTQGHAAIFDQGQIGVDRSELRPDMAQALDAASDQFLFMDLETTGLGGSPLFLIGLMHFNRESFLIEQLLARDYSEEPAVLKHYHDLSSRFRMLVTFNGKSFDLPQITDRSFATGTRFEENGLGHVDLLHEARRRWRDRFPNCKLQTLETLICRRRRVGDIPGDQIPQAYHDFVRTGDARQMKDILHHNALDLVTMAELLVTMLQGRRV